MMNGICILGLIQIVLILLQGAINYDPLMIAAKPLWGSISQYDPIPNVGFMSCYNGASAFLAICFPAFLRRKWIWIAPLFIPAFIYSHTFIGPLAVGIIIICFVSVKYPYFGKVLIAGLAAGTMITAYWVYVDKPDHNFRYKVWKASLTQHMPQKPWLGSGIGHWKLVYSRPSFIRQTADISQKAHFAQAHNEIIQGQFEMGNLFSIILVGYLLNILRRYRDKAVIPALALISILITGSTFFIFHIPFTAMVAIIWVAMLEKTLRGPYENTFSGFVNRRCFFRRRFS